MPRSPFNERQLSILTLVAEGKTNRQIAAALHLTENTVKWYLQQIFQELHAANRVQAVRLARQHGYLQAQIPEALGAAELPAATTPFLGREKQVAELREMILQPQPRLITICGLGGVGKTRLAVEAARSVAGAFVDGVFFIPLEALDSAEGFWAVCLDHLRIPRMSRTPARLLAREYLQRRRSLLILDNTEYLQRFGREISWLLAHTQHLQVLSTSRIRLNLHAEQYYPLDGMDYHNGTKSPTYRLFLNVARRHRPGFQPTRADQEDIVDFCQMVEGLPLAIELGATWMDVMEPAGLVPQLRRSLRDIAHEAADRPAHQRNLMAVVDYSWQFLSEQERQALVRLSIIRGSFSREAALAVGACPTAVLKKLLHGSLLQMTGDNRLKIHELIRQYGEEKVGTTGPELEAARERQMSFTLQWLANETRELRQTMGAAAVQRIRVEWQQVEAAWQRALAGEHWRLLEDCMDLMMYFEARGIWGQGMAFFEHSREAVPATNPYLRARLDEAMSALAIRLYDLAQAEKLARRALAVLEVAAQTQTGPSAAGAYAHITLATASFLKGEYANYTDYLQSVSALTDDYLLKFAEISPHLLAGMHHCACLEYEEGAREFETLIAISDEDAYYLPAIRCMLGLSLRGQDALDPARRQFTMALERALEINVYPAIVGATYELNRLDHPHEPTAARLKALRELAQDVSSVQTIGRVALHNGSFYVTMGFYSQARELLRIGLQLLRGRTSSSEMVGNTLVAGKLLFYELLHRRQIARAAGKKDRTA